MVEFIDRHTAELLLRLVVAVILGGAIGIERGGAKHAAGLRTHIILCLGAASVMVVSECIIKEYGIPQEIMRMGAQIISGVGFLGAGNIIVNGGQVHGITTASGLWTTACVGIAVGAGYYLIAVFMVALMLFVMLGLRSMSQKIRLEQAVYMVEIEVDGMKDTEKLLNKILTDETELNSVKISDTKNESVLVQLEIRMGAHISAEAFAVSIAGMGVLREFKQK